MTTPRDQAIEDVLEEIQPAWGTRDERFFRKIVGLCVDAAISALSQQPSVQEYSDPPAGQHGRMIGAMFDSSDWPAERKRRRQAMGLGNGDGLTEELGQLRSRPSVQVTDEALARIIQWCASNRHHFSLLSVGGGVADHRFCAEVTRTGVGAVAPTFAHYAAEPSQAIAALVAALSSASEEGTA